MRIFDFAFAVFGMFYVSEGFAAILAGPELADAGESGSPAIRNIGIAIGLVSIIRLAPYSREIRQVMSRSWPLWIPVCLALASVLWSGDPGLALRRSSALVLTTLFALFLVVRFEAREFTNCLLAAMLLYCIGSVLMIVLVPSIGVHTAADTRFYEHVGAWRGLSPFKNDFGRIVALAGAVFIAAALTQERRRVLYASAALLAAGLVAGSRSGQAVALFFICVTSMFYLMLLQRLSPELRAAQLVLTIPAILLVHLVADAAISIALEALGKNPTLTGRMNIWPAVFDAMQNNLWLGGGYGSGWGVLVNDHMREVLGREISHAHNGYLNLIVDVGIVGLIVTLMFMLAAGYRVYLDLVSGRNWELVLLASIGMTLILAGNWVASFLLKHNSIFWVMVVYFYCRMGEAARVSAGMTAMAVDLPAGHGGAADRAFVRMTISPGGSR
jgi:exopolysaccharide production protein ExoQ